MSELEEDCWYVDVGFIALKKDYSENKYGVGCYLHFFGHFINKMTSMTNVTAANKIASSL